MKRLIKMLFCPHPTWVIIAGSALSPAQLWKCLRCGRKSEVKGDTNDNS